MKIAREKGKFYIIDLDSAYFSNMPDWRRRVLVEVLPSGGNDRKIFFPLFGRQEATIAMQEEAEIFSYRYKPYVSLEWYIPHLYSIKDKEFAEILEDLMPKLLLEVEEESSRHI